MTRRSYDQFCPVAKALDVVGERWTLLLVRELLLGPRRFTDLLGALPGLGSSLLAERLKQLELAGVIRRVQLPPPAGSTAYQLTDVGRGLGAVVRALASFGARLLGTPSPEDAVRADLLALYAAASAEPQAMTGPRQTCQLHVDDTVVHIRTGGGAARAGSGPAPEGADAVIRTDQAGFVDLALSRRTLAEVVASGQAEVSGDAEAIDRAALLFASVRGDAAPGG
jgi:DNA-binding HxlR family transcriptional regulator